ncbi:MAG: 7-cyano-7-deazaguanine synthase [Planctomycetes bacterium]|nr:7-cyano-7-deazaguanine synthase [Planctomycetota bacterium]
MTPGSTALEPVGVLVSGGLDSAILLAWLREQGRQVQPFYIQSQLHWQMAERAALTQFLAALPNERVLPIVELEQPLADLYNGHWSLTGRDIPGVTSPDEAVFLPGRNALLMLKAALWCQLHGVDQLALATLATNPFADARDEFFASLQACLNWSHSRPVELVRPFARFDKRRVMELGEGFPLELTFSCIAPVGQLHCGACNKCAERQAAFRLVARPDRTRYASQPS